MGKIVLLSNTGIRMHRLESGHWHEIIRLENVRLENCNEMEFADM